MNNTANTNFRHVETEQITFGKKTKKLVKELCPTAKTFKKVGDGYVIRNAQGECVCTWCPRHLNTGLIVIH